MAKIFYNKDAKLNDIKRKTVAIIGYGSQGRSHALNLRDSGIKVIVGQRKGGPNYKKAVKDGFKPVDAETAAKKADVIQLLVQDTIQGQLYRDAIKPHLTKGKALMFSHGFNIHFKQIVPPKDVDVLMIAPKGPGDLVRIQYLEGFGVPCLIAVHQNYTKKALALGLAYAKAIGGTRAGVIKTTFKEETETDLFGEQAVLCGGLSALINTGYETLVEAGYQPEMAYFECLHEMKLIMDLVYARGISGMRHNISDTAEYGDYSRGPRIITKKTKAEMKKILKEIQTGKFAKEWVTEFKKGSPKFKAYRKASAKGSTEKVGNRLRSLMSWV